MDFFVSLTATLPTSISLPIGDNKLELPIVKTVVNFSASVELYLSPNYSIVSSVLPSMYIR